MLSKLPIYSYLHLKFHRSPYNFNKIFIREDLLFYSHILLYVFNKCYNFRNDSNSSNKSTFDDSFSTAYRCFRSVSIVSPRGMRFHPRKRNPLLACEDENGSVSHRLVTHVHVPRIVRSVCLVAFQGKGGKQEVWKRALWNRRYYARKLYSPGSYGHGPAERSGGEAWRKISSLCTAPG